ncbi:endo-1,4-beta-xylanase [Echinicola pacifica]|nr:endo-1,4-beta-xylanase [Echinicola pacifica]
MMITLIINFLSLLTVMGLGHPSAENSTISVSEVFRKEFLVGAALNGRDVMGKDPKVRATLSRHFSSISPENLLKWQSVHPRPEQYNFSLADEYVALGADLNAFVLGHTLVWHNQTPGWVFRDEANEPIEAATLNQRMKEHILTVVGRYSGKIHGWDVVNEAFTDQGEYRSSPWFNSLGKEFIATAFETAHQADPAAELYYNDYNLWKPAKIDAALRMASELQEQGIRIDGIGMQGHYGLESPSLAEIEASIQKIADQGLKVMITELDIDVLPNPTNRRGADIDDNFQYEDQFNPYKNGLPEDLRIKLAQRYADLFELFGKHQEVVTRVTLWGIRDQDSWLNNWPIRGRTAYPLLFEEDYSLKKEIEQMLETLSRGL